MPYALLELRERNEKRSNFIFFDDVVVARGLSIYLSSILACEKSVEKQTLGSSDAWHSTLVRYGGDVRHKNVSTVKPEEWTLFK